MAGKGGKKRPESTILIRRDEVVEGGHHGGAWKVAYADFVTAMMAFFLLMWLLNATTEQQRKGLADYFTPSNAMSHAFSGSGQPFGGHTPFDEGAMVSDLGKVDITKGHQPVVEQTEDGDDPVRENFYHARSGDGVGVGPMTEDQDAAVDDISAKGGSDGQPPPGAGTAMTAVAGQAEAGQQASGDSGRAAPKDDATAADKTSKATAGETAEQAAARQAAAAATVREKAAAEKAAFEHAAAQIRQAVQADPALAELANQLAIDMTPAGLRIQIMDEIKLPMFATGSAAPNERAKLLVQKVVPILNKLNEPISIAGYTDAAPFPGPDRTNWELSAERANATRRLLVDGGLPQARIQSVSGHADRDPLLPADPFAAANRRIAILVQRQAPAPPAAAARAPAMAGATTPAQAAAIGPAQPSTAAATAGMRK